MSKYKLVIFDMDGTLLRDRGIFVIAEKLGFYDKLLEMFKYKGIDFYQKSIEIATLSKGFKTKEYLEIFRKVPYSNNTEKLIRELKNNNIKTAIATDSYQILADDLKERLGIDYAFANNLITNDGIITGELELHNKELREDFCSGRIYSICKSCVLEQLCDELNITPDEVIAIGDGIVDIGMIEKAGLGIAYRAPERVKEHADIVTDDLGTILEYI